MSEWLNDDDWKWPGTRHELSQRALEELDELEEMVHAKNCTCSMETECREAVYELKMRLMDYARDLLDAAIDAQYRDNHVAMMRKELCKVRAELDEMTKERDKLEEALWEYRGNE